MAWSKLAKNEVARWISEKCSTRVGTTIISLSPGAQKHLNARNLSEHLEDDRRKLEINNAGYRCYLEPSQNGNTKFSICILMRSITDCSASRRVRASVQVDVKVR